MKTIGDYWQYLTPQEKDLLAWWTQDRLYSSRYSVATLPFAPLDVFYSLRDYGRADKASLVRKLRAMDRGDHYTLDQILEEQNVDRG